MKYKIHHEWQGNTNLEKWGNGLLQGTVLAFASIDNWKLWELPVRKATNVAKIQTGESQVQVLVITAAKYMLVTLTVVHFRVPAD